MSNSSSVGGPGGAGTPPYTNGTPINTDQTGQTNDRRKVKVNPDTGQTHIPRKSEDSNSPPPSPLAKRKVAHHSGGKNLKPMPDSGGGFKPLGTGNPSGGRTTPSSTHQRKDSLTGQAPTQPITRPKVSVESPGGLTPLPPLTQEQQEQKNKLEGAFTTALSFVKAHKNSFAMGGGAALMVVGIGLMAFPPTAMIGIFPAVFGFVALTTGFSFGMINTDNGGPTPPADKPKNENEEKEKKKQDDKPDDSSGSSSGAVPKGYFAKIETPTTTTEASDTSEASAEVMAKKRHMLDLRRHMEAELKTAFQEDAETHAVTGTTTEASLTPTALENKIVGIVAEYAVRAGLNPDDDVVTSIVESGKMIAKTMAEMEGMSQGERQREFQTLITSLVQRQGIPEDAVRMLCGAFDDFVENNDHLLTDAVKNAMRSTSALIKTILDRQKTPTGLSEGTPTAKPISLVELESILDFKNSDNDLPNARQVRQLKDAIEVQGRKDSMDSQAVELMKKKVFSCCLDLLDTKMSTTEFRAALIAKVDPETMRDERAFLDKALKGHGWFKSEV